ncbi:putative O-methyltransferase that catalyzes the 2 O-methylation steps in the ubiquinone biosynthetic pathway [Trypoxylus dichotomus]
MQKMLNMLRSITQYSTLKSYFPISNIPKRFATFIPPSTINKREVEHFEALSGQWWDLSGPIKSLHSMNSLRIPFIRDGLINTGIIKGKILNNNVPLMDLKIVDVGCGGGCLSEPFSDLGCHVTGIDPSEDLIAVAKHHASQDKSLRNLTYLATTIGEFADSNPAKFDAVVASEVLEHIDEQSKFLTECVKCVKPGGSIFITTINKTLLSKIFAIWFAENVAGFIPKGTHEFEKFISPKVVENILNENGCLTRDVRGQFYNMFTNHWSWTKTCSIFYCLHARDQSQYQKLKCDQGNVIYLGIPPNVVFRQ